MKKRPNSLSRRSFIGQAATAAAGLTIVPRHVLGNGHVPPSDRIQLGFIGLGRLSGGLSQNFIRQPGCQIVAGCDVWSGKMQWFADHVAGQYREIRGVADYRGMQLFRNYLELVEHPDVDAVVVVTPDHWHALQSIAAMRAGKDVYCEKPMTHSIEEGIAMATTAEQTGRIVQTGSMQRSWPDFRKACQLVRNGYIGDISKILVNVGDPARAYDLPEEPLPAGIDWNQWCGPAPLLHYNHRLAPQSNDAGFWPDWRRFREVGGGSLADWGAHMFDIAQWALGTDNTGPVEWTPPTDPMAKRGLHMTYANGVEMVHEDFGRGNAVRFIGSEGSLDVSRSFLDSDPASLVDIELGPGDDPLYDSGGNHYQNWLDSITQRQQPICDVNIGHRSASLCHAANIAYRLHRPLSWDPSAQRFKDDAEANALAYPGMWRH